MSAHKFHSHCSNHTGRSGSQMVRIFLVGRSQPWSGKILCTMKTACYWCLFLSLFSSSTLKNQNLFLDDYKLHLFWTSNSVDTSELGCRAKQLLGGKSYQMVGELEDGETDEGVLLDDRLRWVCFKQVSHLLVMWLYASLTLWAHIYNGDVTKHTNNSAINPPMYYILLTHTCTNAPPPRYYIYYYYYVIIILKLVSEETSNTTQWITWNLHGFIKGSLIVCQR